MPRHPPYALCRLTIASPHVSVKHRAVGDARLASRSRPSNGQTPPRLMIISSKAHQLCGSHPTETLPVGAVSSPYISLMRERYRRRAMLCVYHPIHLSKMGRLKKGGASSTGIQTGPLHRFGVCLLKWQNQSPGYSNDTSKRGKISVERPTSSPTGDARGIVEE